jgi:hypothetical protein
MSILQTRDHDISLGHNSCQSNWLDKIRSLFNVRRHGNGCVAVKDGLWKAPGTSASARSFSLLISDQSCTWKWTLGLLALGVAWRVLRYSLQFPMGG